MANNLQYRQALELRKKNPQISVADAVGQVKAQSTPIANAPIAGQAPAITPIAPVAPIPEPVLDNKTIAEQNKANVQSEIQAGTRPQVGQQPVAQPTAPIAQVPVAPTPVAPATPTPEVKTPKVEPVVIPPTDKKGILNALVTGQTVTPTNTPEYRKASAIHTGFQKFNGMTDVQLLDNLKQGQITTEMGNLLASNPNYQIAKKKLDDIQSTQATNNTMNYLKTGIAGKTVDTPNYLESLSNDLVKKYGLVDQSSQDAFKEIVSNDPEVVDYTKQLHEINRQVADATQLINDGMKEFKQNYQGKLSASEMLNYMGNRFRDATDNLNALNNTKTYLTADLKNATDMAIAEYGAVQTDIVRNQAVRDKFMQQEMALQGNMAQMQMEADFAKKQAEENLNNPAMAIENVMNEYKKLGIPFTSTIQSRLQEFVNSGKSLPDYLTQMTESIQASPAYQKYKALQDGQMSDVQKMKAQQNFELGKMGMEQDFQMALAQAKNVTSGKFTKLDDGLYQDESGNVYTGDEIKNAKLMGNSYITKQIGEEGGECGFYASRATGLGSTPGGNSKEARTQAFADKTPQVGGMVFFGGAGYDPTYGHISIVTSVNQDGTITVKDSNYRNDKKVDERTVPASTATGFYNNTPLANGLSAPIGEQRSQFTDSDIAVLGSVAKLDKQGKATLTENGLTDRDWANFNAGLLPPTAKQKSESQVVVDRVDDILKGDWTDAVGPFLGKARVFTGGGTDRKVTELKVQALKDLLAMANLDKIKGAMSDKDIEFLRNTATYLSTDLSETEFEKTLNEIKAKYAGIAGGSPTNIPQPVNTGAGKTDSMGIR